MTQTSIPECLDVFMNFQQIPPKMLGTCKLICIIVVSVVTGERYEVQSLNPCDSR